MEVGGYAYPKLAFPKLQLRYLFQDSPPNKAYLKKLAAYLESEIFVLGILRQGIQPEVIRSTIEEFAKQPSRQYRGQYGEQFFESARRMLNRLDEVDFSSHLASGLATPEDYDNMDAWSIAYQTLSRSQDPVFKSFHLLADIARDRDAHEMIQETYLLGSDAKDILEELRNGEIAAWEERIEDNRSILDDTEPGPIKNFPPPRYEDYLTQTCDREGLVTPEPGVPQSSQRDRRSQSRRSRKEKKYPEGDVLPQGQDLFAS